jgi:hypothetical protein
MHDQGCTSTSIDKYGQEWNGVVRDVQK